MANQSLVMTFLNREGSRTSLTTPAVKDDLTEAEVVTALDSVITKNTFFSSVGDLITKHSAQIVERTVTELSVR
jgi:hypothetical protein